MLSKNQSKKNAHTEKEEERERKERRRTIRMIPSPRDTATIALETK